MHFIQNSWFAVYSIWLLLMTLGIVGIISYVHNRQKFLRRISVYFTIAFIAALATSFSTDRSLFLHGHQMGLTEINQDNNQVEAPSLVNSAFRFVGSILRDKISN